MKIFHIFIGGNIGGIETLCKDYAKYSKHENIIVILWGDGPLAEEMQSEGVEVINLHASSRNILTTIKSFLAVCGERNPDVVIAHHAASMSHLCLMAVKKKYPKIKTIAYAHGNAIDMCRANDRKGLWLRKVIVSNSLRRADAVVAISNSVGKSLSSWLNVPQEKIHVIYNGVKVERFKIQNIRNNETPRLIFVGRLVKEKGVQIILESLSQIKSDLNYQMLIVGDGPYRKVLEEQCTELKLSDCVKFHGSSRRVPELLAESDIFIHVPIWEEGFGITIIEAMAAGLVCICAESGAIPEIIMDGKNGYIVPQNNSVQLARVIKEVLYNLNEERIGSIKTKAILRACDFSIEKFVDSLDMLIEAI